MIDFLCPKCMKRVTGKFLHCPHCGNAFNYISKSNLKSFDGKENMAKCPNCGRIITKHSMWCRYCHLIFVSEDDF